MKISYFFSSPSGDISLTDDDFRQPFLLEANIAHQFLTLGDYLEGVVDFVTQECLSLLSSTFDLVKDDIVELIVRSEKHGVLYHIASVEIITEKCSQKLAISAALTNEGVRCLDRDFSLMQQLASGQWKDSDSLPHQYCKKKVPVKSGTDTVLFLMTMSEWLAGFHEWHLSIDEERDAERIQVWDNESGSYYLERGQELQLFFKASRILSDYFDPVTSCQIYPWHHAAGDFIVKRLEEKGEVDVKLITVRDYQPLFEVTPGQEHAASPLVNYILFFIHLTIRMRLDRMQGVDQMVWLGSQVVGAVIGGFVESCRQKKNDAQGVVSSLLAVLPTFGVSEFVAVSQQLLDLYREESGQDYELIAENLEKHLEVVDNEVKKMLG